MSAPQWGKAGLSVGLLEKELVRHPGTSPPCLPNSAGIDSHGHKARQRDSHLSQGVSRSCTPEDTASAGCQQRRDTVCGEGLWG